VRPTLGVRFDPQVNQALVEQVGVKGVFVLGVDPGSPAAAAGLKPARIGRNESVVIGDVITAVDDRPVAKVEDLLDALDHASPGQQSRVTLQRGRDKVQVSVQLAAGR
jgi:S1-C subfamily serine protease